MPPAYTAQQKAQISRFTSLTQADKSTAAKLLRQADWDVQNAANAYFSGSTNMAPNPHKGPLNKLFDSYREDAKNEPDEVNMEGMMNMVGTLELSLEDVDLLIFSELVQSPTLGKLTREGFVDGLAKENVSDPAKIRKVVLDRKGLLASPSFKQNFRSIYRHTFEIARPQGQKSVPMENAIEYWKLLFTEPSLAWKTPSSPWLDWWTEFLQERWKKSVNKDMWNQTLTFAQKTLDDESMKWWSEDSAWPGVIDEFVEYVQKEKRNSAEAMDVS